MNDVIVQAVTKSPLVKIFLTVAIASIVIALLPSTPFLPYLVEIRKLPYLSYVNWFIPFKKMAAVMAVWWTAVVVYYGLRWILGQLNIVGGK